MEHSRKVALVPQQLLSMLMAQQQLNPAVGQLTNLDQNMQNVLNTSNLPSDLKHKQYSQMMHRYQLMRDQELNKSFPVDVSRTEPSRPMIPADEIIESLPKNYKNKGRLLLSHIKRTNDIGVDDLNQVVIDGKPLEGSNITDLVFDYVKPGKQWGPTGWKEFGKALKRTNVPRQAIVNTTRWNQIDLPNFGLLPLQQVQQPIQSSDDDMAEDLQFQTPPATKRPRDGTPGSSAKKPGPSKVVVLRRSTRDKKLAQKHSPWRQYKQK